MKSRVVGCWLGAVSLLACAGSVLAQDKAPATDPHAGVVADQLVGQGYRRVFRTETRPVTPEEIAELAGEGKQFEIDPGTGGLVNHTFTDYLPQGWLMEAPAGGVRVDSMGNPIVNDTPGLPAWSQRDVDALRGEVAHWRDELSRQASEGRDTLETESILGNYLGQAITRGISVDDIVNIDNGAIVTAAVGQSVVKYLHFYENERFNNQSLFHYTYQPTAYTPRVAAFVARHGSTLEFVQAVEPSASFDDRGVSCYSRTATAPGMTILATPTVIWSATGDDDAQADVSTGFPLFYFYDCQDRDNNDQVRVSTNGYISFFQQGGNSTNGTDFSNDPMPTAGTPDGIAAPFWDDLWVAPAQGNTDSVRYKTEGAVGARVFTTEYFSMSHLGGTTNEFHFFQVKLFEGSDTVQLVYDVGGNWLADTSDSASQGVENYDGTQAACGFDCGNTLNFVSPPNNYTFSYFRPSNDDCANGYQIFNGTTYFSQDLHHATGDGVDNCGATDNNRDLWYYYVAPCDGAVTFTTCGSRDTGGVGVGPDTVLSVYSGCPGNLGNQLACADDTGGSGCSGNDSVATVNVVDGQVVRVRVTNFGNSTFRMGSGYINIGASFVGTGAAPANDNAANAFEVVNGSAGVQDLGCATNDGSTNCGGSIQATNPDLWYTFRAQCAGTLVVNTLGSYALSGLDSVLSVHSAIPGTGANTLACNDQFGSNDSQVSVALSPGQRVYIRVTHWSNLIGDGRFNIAFAYTNSGGPPPSNDTCAGAITLHCNDSVIGATCDATSDIGSVPAACGVTGVGAPGVWYRVVGDGNPIAISTCSADTTYDTKLHVYSGSCGALTCVDSNDDSTCSFNGLFSRLGWNTTPGVEYYILVNGFGGGIGQFRLTISNAGRPFNDDCANAQNAFAGGTYTGNLWCATPDGSSSCRGTTPNPSVWYRFVAPADGVLTVDACGSIASGGIDMVLNAFAGSCAGPEVLCNDDFGGSGCNILDSNISGPMTAGQVVLLRVTHFGSSIHNGNYILNVNFAGCDTIDFNGDGLFPDTQDITDFITVFGGGFCAAPNPPICNTDIDFNNDGLFPDTQDITDFINYFGGGTCP